MSLLQLVNNIDHDNFEEEIREDFVDRKKVLNKMGKWGKNLALSMVPLGAVAAFAEPARAQSGGRTATEALQFALKLEYLEAEFYSKGTSSGVIPMKSQKTFQEIADNEADHVNFLKAALGSKAPPKPTFNFNVANLKPFQNYQHFLILSQAFEDTGVRAYKGQAKYLIGSNAYLTAALRIHSVEARHASAVRRISGIQGWIPKSQPGAPKAIAPVYAGEANTTHAGVDVTQYSSVGKTSITEAWDEPLKTKEVLAIAKLFIVNN